MNATEPCQWLVNIGSDNGLVPSDNKLLYEPMLTQICVTLWHHRATKIHVLTHWWRVTHICVRKLTTIASDNGLLPRWYQAIIWTKAGILLIGPLGTNFSEILIGIYIFSFKKMHLKMLSGKWRPFCLGLNVLMTLHLLCWFRSHTWIHIKYCIFPVMRTR